MRSTTRTTIVSAFEQTALPLAPPVGALKAPQSELERPVEPVGAASQPSPHLIAARRLSRRIRRLPDHSEEQTRTGLAICQHLRLLLAEETPAAPPH